MTVVYYLVQMRLALVVSIISIIFGISMCIVAGVAYPIITSTLNNIQTKTTDTLTQADAALENTQGMLNSLLVVLDSTSATINSTIPGLTASAQSAQSVSADLYSAASQVSSIGQTFAGISFMGLSPFSSIANSISSISTPLQTAASNLQTISASLTTTAQQSANLPNDFANINTQLSALNTNLINLHTTAAQTQSDLPTYFTQLNLIVMLAVVGVAASGVLIILVGLSTLSIRSQMNKHTT
jgi:hypothetical protein